MNCKQANEIPIKDVVEGLAGVSNGINKGKDVWYRSPFRDEKTPSFRVDLNSNRWKDFGKPGKNEGTVIDFVIEFKGCDINHALAIVEDFARSTRGQLSSSFSSFLEQKDFDISKDQEKVIDKLGENDSPLSDNLELLKVKELENRALLEYVRERKIDVDIAKSYLKEIYYRNKKADKKFFAVAFENDSHAYEYRNKYMGGVIGHKDITSYSLNLSKIAVFEGFFDFLTYLTINKEKALSEAYIVLNSVNLIDRSIEKLSSGNYSRIDLYLDNDTAGDQSVLLYKEKFGSLISDKRSLYEGYKDYNEYLQ